MSGLRPTGPAQSALGFRDGESVDDNLARAGLVKFAQAYGVIRNFKKERDEPRLARAWESLRAIERPQHPGQAQDRVEALMKAMSTHYTNQLLSAATKFLWIRFRSPVIIYDTIAWKWMCRKGGCRPNGSYTHYCEAWQKSFNLRRQGIVEASLELPAIRKFLRPNDISEAELSASYRVAGFTSASSIFSCWMTKPNGIDSTLEQVPYNK